MINNSGKDKLSKDRKIENLTELNEMLENYFSNTLIPQLFIDADLILQKFTPPTMKQFNLLENDIGKTVHEIKDNFRFPEFIEDIQQVISINKMLEKEIQTTDMRWYHMNINPYVERKSKRSNGVIVTFVSITTRINDLKDQQKLISDYETLLDTISHDIKAPLTNRVVAMQLFKSIAFEDSKQYKLVLEIVDNGVKKMQTLINDLTDTRKLEFKYKAEEELINFEDLLEDVRLTLANEIKASGTFTTVELNVTEINFSKRKLRSILYNLVGNAIKFKSPERSMKIHIRTGKENDFIVISVKDNGIGIEESKQEAIFFKYYKMQNNIEGSGIGLYLVREIVNNSGGKITLQSIPGEGSEFKVYLKAS